MASILSRPQWVNPPDDKTGRFRDDYVNVMIIDALAPCVNGASTAVLFTMQYKLDLIFPKEGFNYGHNLRFV